jgi:putative peptidoglycan lipid II flippase
MEQKILPESTSSEDDSTTAVASADLQPESSAVPSVEASPSHGSALWGIGPFRFCLANLCPGRDFAERCFSIAEAAFLLMIAYLVSHGLDVIRQTLFNALFGTGPQANTYYAAFQLPDTLFTLVAGGALIQAFVPVFVSKETDR